MTPRNFLATAEDLAGSDRRGRPRQTNLRRAVSTTYYALFNCLAACCANMLVGGPGSDRSRPAWRQTYRALQHGMARRRCQQRAIVSRFPAAIQDFAQWFSEMQAKRHAADYDPYAAFSKSDVLQDIAAAAAIIDLFNATPARDRRAFAVYVLLDVRNG